MKRFEKFCYLAAVSLIPLLAIWVMSFAIVSLTPFLDAWRLVGPALAIVYPPAAVWLTLQGRFPVEKRHDH